MALPLAAYIFMAGVMAEDGRNPFWPSWWLTLPVAMLLVSAFLTFVPLVPRMHDEPPQPAVLPPPSPAPPSAGPVFKMRGGSGKFRTTTITGHDRVFETEDTDVETDDLTVNP